MWNYIVDPNTNKKVNIFGKIGKKVILNYLTLLEGGSTKDENKISGDEKSSPDLLCSMNDGVEEVISFFNYSINKYKRY